MNKISCLIADDEPNAVKLLEDHIRKVSFLELRQVCYDAFEVMSFLDSQQVDLIFLDIHMPQLSGMELAAMLPKAQRIIFTTAFSAYALEGYDYNALDYLLKPITFKRFMQAAEKSRELLLPVKTAEMPENSADQASIIFIKSGKALLKMQYSQILYFEAFKEYVTVVHREGTAMIYKRMKQLEAQLPAFFVRIHNSYIINIHHVDKITDGRAILGSRELPVSSGYKDQLADVIAKMLL